jgi:acetone carboxylase gamma subunit
MRVNSHKNLNYAAQKKYYQNHKNDLDYKTKHNIRQIKAYHLRMLQDWIVDKDLDILKKTATHLFINIVNEKKKIKMNVENFFQDVKNWNLNNIHDFLILLISKKYIIFSDIKDVYNTFNCDSTLK